MHSLLCVMSRPRSYSFLDNDSATVYIVAHSGDLKTFLLARRQMVGQSTREAEEVKPEALTRMALDVAYGLKYLTDMKYVHR